jgi:hypothetical protein
MLLYENIDKVHGVIGTISFLSQQYKHNVSELVGIDVSFATACTQ